METTNTQCCIAGGGPAGMMLGFLLARAGVQVVVLEKHADFLRDFRGDTIHPSTLEIMYELGILEDFLKRPHQETPDITAFIGGKSVTIADFTHLPTHCKFLALMPQWDFLDFIAAEAKRYPAFKLLQQAEVTNLIEEDGIIKGVAVRRPAGAISIRANLVVGCDGRHSTVRALAGLKPIDIGAPIDVLWMKLPRKETDRRYPAAYMERGHVFVMLDRDDYWQCAYVIPKGGYESIKSQGLPALREAIATVAPQMKDRLEALQSWDDIRLLTVTVDRLEKWYRDGLLCIGDAAHAMSPIGGVGINLAIQDAVAAANILWEPLKLGALRTGHLTQVQKRREFPTRVTQTIQVAAQNNILSKVLASSNHLEVPGMFRLFQKFHSLRRIPARVVGLGVRPEHVQSPDVMKQ